jgi:hypothetical protein
MKKESIIKRKAYYYFVLFLIILFGIFAFYLSCKSKSPTEATSALHNQVFAQSTNNTTTSSSTTTTSRPGSFPTNTTTIITSRTLTTTSTSTTSTTTSTTTTSIRPTATTSVHSTCATAKLELVEVKVNGTPVADNGTITVHPGDVLKIVTKFCNNGTGISQLCQYGFGSTGCIISLKHNLPLDIPLPPGSCATGFIKASISAGCSQNSSIILIIWRYCDSQGNHCNEPPTTYTINLNIEPIE